MQDMPCDLCGNTHSTKECHLFSQSDQKPSNALSTDEHLAYKSLPSWIQVSQSPDGKLSVRTHQRLPKYTKLGPLMGPQMPYIVSNDFFPLKICYNLGGVTYFDISSKHHCNWLSLIPKGSASNRNLVVCQIDDLLYYITTEDIGERSELRVWYGPFYYERISGDLKVLRENKGSNTVVIRKEAELLNHPNLHINERTNKLDKPSLSLIAVGKRQLTLTYNLSTNNGSNNRYYLSGEVENPAEAVETGDSTLDGFIQAAGISCKYVHKEQSSETSNDQSGLRNELIASHNDIISPSIVIANGKDILKDYNSIITFIINSVDIYEMGSQYTNGNVNNTHLEQSVCEDIACEEFSVNEKGKSVSSSSRKSNMRHHRKQKPKREVGVADYNVVKQLPTRALGAFHPQSWSCRYCGDNFVKLLPFANHIKAHLLWIIGRCHQCDDCGRSFSSSPLLERHKVVVHKRLGELASLRASESRGETEVSVKHEIISDEESVDDINLTETKQTLKSLATLPTNNTKGPHNCQICPKQFHKAEYLLRHLRKHTGDFTCQKCHKVFARKESLQKHACPDGIQKGSLECSLCNRIFFNTILMEQHYVKHKNSKKCERCGRYYSHIGTLEKHMKLCPSVEISTTFQCAICNKEFTKQSVLDRHMKSHNHQFQCELCKKTYLSQTSYRQHAIYCRQLQQIVNLGQVVCEDCGEVLTDAQEFRVHYQKHTHPYHCTGCNHQFRTRAGYEVHVCEIGLQCDQCPSEFRSVQALNRHSVVHGPPPFTCASCRRSYYRKESLHRHVCSFEMEGKEQVKPQVKNNLKCNVCGAAMATRHSLSTHLKTAHGGAAAKEFECEVCGKQFYRKDLLREHAAVHAPPSFPCPDCNKLFKTRKSLEVHSMLHLGIKRFACKYCNKKFHQKINLTRHERSHMPRGAVKCQNCGVQCVSTDDLKAHLLSHTFIQPPQGISEMQNNGSDVIVSKEVAHNDILQVYSDGREQSHETLIYCEKKAQLKMLSKGEAEFRLDPRTFSTSDDVMSAEENIQIISKQTNIQVNNYFKRSESPDNGYNQAVMNMPILTSDSLVGHDSVTRSDLQNTSELFATSQRIQNFCVSTCQQSLKSTCIQRVQKSQSSENYSCHFQEGSRDLSSGACETAENMEVSNSPSYNRIMHTYHLNLDNCHVTVEKRPEDFGQDYDFSNEIDEDVSMSCENSLIEPVSSSTTVTMSTLGKKSTQ